MSTVKLADCCTFFSGGTPTKGRADYWNGEIPWFSPKDMKSFELISSQDRISEAAVRKSSIRLVKSGTILVVGRSGVLAHTLPVGIVQQPSAFNQDIKAIVPRDGYDPEYISLFLVARQRFVLKGGVKRGPTVHSLVANFIEELEIPDIPIDQQRQIAARAKAHLAKVETAQQAARVQMRDANLLRTKIVDAVFDGLEERVLIADVAKVQSGYAFKSESFKTSGVRLLRNTNILPGKIYWDDVVCLDESEAKRYPGYVLEDGDVLISLDRPLISSGIKVARVGEADLPSLLLQRVGRFLLKPQAIDADFLYAFLQSTRFIEAISGHDQSLGVPHISPSQVESVEIPLLPLDEQRHIVTRLKVQLAEADALRSALELQQNELDALPQRILTQAFRN
jgi:type I restriction enzyme S subunit